MLGGQFVTESVFNWPGIGSMMLDAIRQRDYGIVQAVVMLVVIGFMLGWTSFLRHVAVPVPRRFVRPRPHQGQGLYNSRCSVVESPLRRFVRRRGDGGARS